MMATGMYGSEALRSMKFATARLLAAVSLGVIFLSVVGFLLPTATLWRANSFYAMALAIVALFVTRLILTQTAKSAMPLPLVAVAAVMSNNAHASPVCPVPVHELTSSHTHFTPIFPVTLSARVNALRSD